MLLLTGAHPFLPNRDEPWVVDHTTGPRRLVDLYTIVLHAHATNYEGNPGSAEYSSPVRDTWELARPEYPSPKSQNTLPGDPTLPRPPFLFRRSHRRLSIIRCDLVILYSTTLSSSSVYAGCCISPLLPSTYNCGAVSLHGAALELLHGQTFDGVDQQRPLLLLWFTVTCFLQQAAYPPPPLRDYL